MGNEQIILYPEFETHENWASRVRPHVIELLNSNGWDKKKALRQLMIAAKGQASTKAASPLIDELIEIRRLGQKVACP